MDKTLLFFKFSFCTIINSVGGGVVFDKLTMKAFFIFIIINVIMI